MSWNLHQHLGLNTCCQELFQYFCHIFIHPSRESMRECIIIAGAMIQGFYEHN